MPPLEDRPKMSLQMWAALKSRIMRERQGKRSHQEADEAIKRTRPDQEWMRRASEMTLEEVIHETQRYEKRLRELKQEKQQLQMQLREVLRKEANGRRAPHGDVSDVDAA
ncbi:hypothetical protein HPB52_010955 [Rhipicephalus sanguineus]|uniref:Uncharacterized protein n=1 Tax=Rhipicephalus sanguineus TaxID=34632 RepID=A0A9D4T3I4_RHISA|nr:hypothetical protein HPB52_010955 [Rhipicephalus sanguineus]